MRNKILAVASILLCFVGVGLAQSLTSAQPDPGQTNGQDHATTVTDARLVAAPPLSSDLQEQFQQAIKDIHFDFDRADLRAEDRTILASDAEWLKSHPDVLITLEGDADERGDVVYNLVLSGERALTAMNALVELGVPADRIAFATGWGKLYPICSQSDESCWGQNRRTHFATWPLPENTQMASR